MHAGDLIFSSFFQNDYMDSRKAVLDLKDVPPPPHHTSSQSSQLFPLLPQDCHQQQPSQQQQEGASPKVSICTHCDYYSTEGYGVLSGGGGISSNNGISSVVSLYMTPGTLEAPSSGSSTRPGACSIASSPHSCQHNHSCGNRGEAPDTLQPSLFPSSAPLASSVPSVSSLPTPMHGSCLASSGCYPCGVDCSPTARGTQRPTAHGDHPTTTTTTTAHFYSNPMHLNVERTVCLKGAHYCQECLLKSDKVWASVPLPPPQTAPIPIPMCNGCGTSSDAMLLMPTTGLGKTGQKYGSPESSAPDNIPPVGVFWDIENCSVPSGRSAVAVVQRIRSRFFQGHREAEFICVCDISKESKAVIQELNNCQVTVAHINATAKNAADDKLRQSLRRFAETHTAPATVVLVSSDVNFASELSDLRHRHGFQVILVHGSHTSPALLQHAHRHVAFQEITADLPPRMPMKAQELGGVEAKPKMTFHHLDKGLLEVGKSSAQSNLEPRTMKVLEICPSVLSCPHRRECSSPRSATESPLERGDRSSGEFHVSTPSAFSKLNLHRSFSPLVLSQGSWSSSPGPEGPAEPFSEGAEVQVANLDYRMSRKDLQQTLHDTFSRYGRVKGVELSPHTDYQLKATIQMSSLQQAIGAVSGLHRYKIGGKRIHVSLITGGSSKSLGMLSSEIICILQDAPANCLPLFKFTEIYEKKYSRKLIVGDLYRLPEVVAVREQGGSRLVCLLPSSQIRQSPLGSSQSQEGSSSTSGSPVVFEELEYHEPVCRQHFTQQDFSEADFDPDSYKIPFVVMSLSTLASQVHSLLQSHEGTLPLLSFPDCYAAKFSPLSLGDETVEGGVPLEHLITCIPSITIVTAQNGFKVIKWVNNKPPAPNSEPWMQRCKSPVGNPQLIQFSREIIDLLKSRPSCMMPISKFIPSYHHHFAKQCRVSDYGYSKLLELLEAVPHVLQILGMGTKRLLTLTHRAQVKRFTQDLLKLLKFQASKQVAIKDFMQAYHWCFSRDWRVIDYGICDLMDLLAEIPDTTITITQQDMDTVISVPKRERTVEEMERTKQFGKEVVDLLRHQPHCRMPFSKFIPTYHHHFGRQCKLTYYGFTKLMELFEAIPEVLMVLECGEEKMLTLTEVERVKALAAQLVKLLRAQKNSSLPVSHLLTEYSKTYGYGLRLQDYDASSLPALLAKLCHVVKVVDGLEGREVQLINRKSLRSLTCQLLVLLMSQEEDQTAKGLKVSELSQHYQAIHRAQLNPCEYGFLSLSELLKSLPYLVEVSEEWVRLTRLYQFARKVRALLHTYHYNQIFLTEFPVAYNKFTGSNLQPRSYGYTSTDELLSAIPQVVWIKGHGHKRIIVLKNDMKARASSAASDSPQSEENKESPRDSPCSNSSSSLPDGDVAVESELLCLTSQVDLLCGPVPSCLPSPQLHPDPVLLQQADLIRFEERTPPSSTGQLQCPVVKFAFCCGTYSRLTLQSTSDPPESKDASRVDEQPPVPPQPPNMNSSSVDSPSRRAPRSKIKLAANFSFTTGP
uniref:Meiosis regulator and mRNA stability factor 1 n=1 Tax=Myripristis murdjan TaxID=586833 RepID=A0A668A514_9TELE